MNVPNSGTWSDLGNGVGLRPPHYPFVLTKKPPVDWFEVVSENFMDTEGRPIHILEKIRKDYPVVLHGVSLSIGSADPLHLNYLKSLKTLIKRIEPAFVSDHLCWTGVEGANLHDLLPLPYTAESLSYVVDRVKKVQEILGRRLILENPSTYIRFKHSDIPEWEFMSELARRADCGILLDVNNVYVNAFNHQFDARIYIDSIPSERVAYLHMAGHTDMGSFYFDTHDGKVIPPVWDLYEYTLKMLGPKNTLIEWDAKIPSFPELLKESEKARAIQNRLFHDDKKKSSVA